MEKGRNYSTEGYNILITTIMKEKGREGGGVCPLSTKGLTSLSQ